MKSTALFTGLAICLVATSIHAALEFQRLPSGDPDQQMYAPSVACGPGAYTAIAYNSQDVLAMTFVGVQIVPTLSPTMPEVLPDPVLLGAGFGPLVCWTREGWVCVYSDGGVLIIQESDTLGNWDPASPTLIQLDGGVLSKDLCGIATEGPGPSALLAVQIFLNPPYGGFKTVYLQRTTGGWSQPEVVVPETPNQQKPQVVWTPGLDGPLPTVFYQGIADGALHLWQTTRNQIGTWSTPIEVCGDGVSSPTEIHGNFAAIRHDDAALDLLGLGQPATCPCRSMFFQRNDGGWSATTDVTGDHDTYNMAYSPCLAGDAQGRAHAFWMQVGSGPRLEAHSRTLEYRIGKDGVWVDRGDEFADQNLPAVGLAVAMDVNGDGLPVMAWTRTDTIAGEPQPIRIWFAQARAISAVGDEVPQPAPGLTAWPNPFNPRVKLALRKAAAGPVRLEIFDACGRRLRTLLDGTSVAYRAELSWDGTDGAGRPLPSGVYFARAATAAGSAVTKLVLAR